MIFRTLILLLLSLPCYAASITTATFTFTNPATPTATNAITLNGSDVRYMTNLYGSTTFLSNSNGYFVATNFYRHIVTNPFTSTITASMPATNQVKITFSSGAVVFLWGVSNLASIAYGSSSFDSNLTVRWPISSEPSLAVRSNIVSDLVTNIQLHSSNIFAGLTLALTNFLSKTNGNQIQSNIAGVTWNGTNLFLNRANVWSNGYAIGASNIGGMVSNSSASNEFQGTVRIATLVATNMTIAGTGSITNAGVNSFAGTANIGTSTVTNLYSVAGALTNSGSNEFRNTVTINTNMVTNLYSIGGALTNSGSNVFRGQLQLGALEVTNRIVGFTNPTPTGITNGAWAIWNSNGVVFIRYSTVGSATEGTDKKLAP